jgi:hypothetical protein
MLLLLCSFLAVLKVGGSQEADTQGFIAAFKPSDLLVPLLLLLPPLIHAKFCAQCS